jgi:polar amino acid transport system substrate-binding protein
VTNLKTFLVAIALMAVTGVAASKMVAAAPVSSASVSFSASQVAAGQKVFEQSCAQCHGANLQGVSAPALSGANFKASVASTRPTVGDLFQYITQNMPLGNPASLSHDQYASIMAFVLSKNGFKAGGAPLTFDSASKSDAKIVKGQ